MVRIIRLPRGKFMPLSMAALNYSKPQKSRCSKSVMRPRFTSGAAHPKASEEPQHGPRDLSRFFTSQAWSEWFINEDRAVMTCACTKGFGIMVLSGTPLALHS